MTLLVIALGLGAVTELALSVLLSSSAAMRCVGSAPEGSLSSGSSALPPLALRSSASGLRFGGAFVLSACVGGVRESGDCDVTTEKPDVVPDRGKGEGLCDELTEDEPVENSESAELCRPNGNRAALLGDPPLS